MDAYYTIKHWLKLGRWQARRAAAALRWGPQNLHRMPALIGNAMPKSGSHLIIQVLHGLPRLGPFVNTGFPPLNRGEDNRKLPVDATLAVLQSMRPGDLAYGYLRAAEPYLSTLKQPGRATVFVYRDPRDMIISHVFYATQRHPGHGMHRYYTEVLTSMEQRIDAAILGVQADGYHLSGVRARYQGYLGWLDQPNVLCLRFEDLIQNRDTALNRLLDYLTGYGFVPRQPRRLAVEMLMSAIDPARSGTFRKGQPGNWREHFTAANKATFKSSAGDLLVRLGYEEDDGW